MPHRIAGHGRVRQQQQRPAGERQRSLHAPAPLQHRPPQPRRRSASSRSPAPPATRHAAPPPRNELSDANGRPNGREMPDLQRHQHRREGHAARLQHRRPRGRRRAGGTSWRPARTRPPERHTPPATRSAPACAERIVEHVVVQQQPDQHDRPPPPARPGATPAGPTFASTQASAGRNSETARLSQWSRSSMAQPSASAATAPAAWLRRAAGFASHCSRNAAAARRSGRRPAPGPTIAQPSARIEFADPGVADRQRQHGHGRDQPGPRQRPHRPPLEPQPAAGEECGDQRGGPSKVLTSGGIHAAGGIARSGRAHRSRATSPPASAGTAVPRGTAAGRSRLSRAALPHGQWHEQQNAGACRPALITANASSSPAAPSAAHGTQASRRPIG